MKTCHVPGPCGIVRWQRKMSVISTEGPQELDPNELVQLVRHSFIRSPILLTRHWTFLPTARAQMRILPTSLVGHRENSRSDLTDLL